MNGSILIQNWAYFYWMRCFHKLKCKHNFNHWKCKKMCNFIFICEWYSIFFYWMRRFYFKKKSSIVVLKLHFQSNIFSFNTFNIFFFLDFFYMKSLNGLNGKNLFEKNSQHKNWSFCAILIFLLLGGLNGKKLIENAVSR